MPNIIPTGTNFPRRINMYVPSMQYSMDVNINGACRTNFGAPLAASGTLVATLITIPAGPAVFDLSGVPPFPEPFGRTLAVVASGATTNVLTISGWDYLHQPISESFTLNGITPVAGKKAFKDFNTVTANAGGTPGCNIGNGTGLGLPYKCLRVGWEVANGLAVAAGTLTAAVLTDPQTATTGDPRGTYVPTTTLNGTNIISAVFDYVNDVNSSNNGGLHGIRQFAA